MKTRIFLFIGILLFSVSFTISEELTVADSNSRIEAPTLIVYSSPDLYPLTTKWISEYTRVNPAIKMQVIISEDKNITGSLKTGTGIGFMSDESFETFNNQSNWNMVVGRDVIVPIMNATNPFTDEIVRKGITSEGLARILENSDKQNWGMLMGNSQTIPDIPMHYYFVNDPFIISRMASFVNANRLKLAGIRVASESELISAIQKDPNALGFCRLIQIIDSGNQNMVDQIKLVPIDKNRNGKIDYMEAIYDNLEEFSRGVWIGKYPKALSGNIYSVSYAKPKNQAELAFLNWVLTDGQQYLNANGYIDLVINERQSQMDKINNEPSIYAASPTTIYSILKIILLFLFAIFVTGFIVDELVRRRRLRKSSIVDSASGYHPVFDENSIVIPKGLYFDKTHTWAFMKKDGTVKVGIDDFLQHITGSLTRIEMKQTGEKIKKGDRLLTVIRKGKQLTIYAPISGTIKAHNQSLITNSSLVNDAPYGEGWIYIIEPANWQLEIQFLTMADKYKTWLKDEFSRLKDFFAAAVRIHVPAFVIVLQDGGVLRDGILADLGPEVWEDFQTKFIDKSR
jgi:glycine cleavage system H lipoate-binding protein/ABC-type phosphate transport system substrate-binding protein